MPDARQAGKYYASDHPGAGLPRRKLEPKGKRNMETLSAYITHHAPAWAQGDTGIAILCLASLGTGYLWAYARRKGAL